MANKLSYSIAGYYIHCYLPSDSLIPRFMITFDLQLLAESASFYDVFEFLDQSKVHPRAIVIHCDQQYYIGHDPSASTYYL